jgi:DNA-binding winged helix-turn-helix (wHTH) protein
LRFGFGDCVLDLETRQLSRAGRVVHLSPKAFQLLEALIAERPRALSKERIHELLWPGTYVTDAALTGLVAEIRAATADDARAPRWIRTVPVFGYAFCGEAFPEKSVRSAATGHIFRLLWGEREIELVGGENVLGRDSNVRVWIDDKSVSRHHARIRVEKDVAMLEDLNSKNGTFLGGQRLTAPTALRDGDEIHLGDVKLLFHAFAGGVSTSTAESRR